MEWLLIILAAGLYLFFKYFKMEQVPADSVKVLSRASGKTYYVRPEQLSCNCPDWQKRRQQFKQDDPRRLCKHLVQYYIGQNKLPKSLSLYQEALEWFYKKGWKIPADKEITKFSTPQGDVAYFKDREDDIWYSVCFQGKRYGWDKRGNSWAHGTPTEVQDIVFRALNNIPENLESKAIKTISAEQLKQRMDWRVVGLVEGEEITAHISLRKNAKWHDIVFDGKKFSFHTDGSISNKKFRHLVPALSDWIESERVNLRAEIGK